MESNKIVNNQESFEELAQSLKTMNEAFQQSAASAVNKHVTCRNWLNGFYIVHYEQNGSDRAKYGEKLLQNFGLTDIFTSHLIEPSCILQSETPIYLIIS